MAVVAGSPVPGEQPPLHRRRTWGAGWMNMFTALSMRWMPCERNRASSVPQIALNWLLAAATVANVDCGRPATRNSSARTAGQLSVWSLSAGQIAALDKASTLRWPFRTGINVDLRAGSAAGLKRGCGDASASPHHLSSPSPQLRISRPNSRVDGTRRIGFVEPDSSWARFSITASNTFRAVLMSRSLNPAR